MLTKIAFIWSKHSKNNNITFIIIINAENSAL